MNKFELMKQHYFNKQPVVNYSPLHVYIEPTNCCNLSCSHCPIDRLERPKGFIDFDLYKSLIEQISAMKIGWVYLFFIGESLLHKQIKEMIELAQASGIQVRLHTNGTIKKIRDIQVDDLHISLNVTDFKLMKENIDYLVHKNIPFVLESIDNTSIQLIPEPYHRFINNKAYLNWAGDVDPVANEDVVCSHPFKSFVIMYDGRCVPCCVDFKGEYLIGDATKESLSDIWNGYLIKQIRTCPVELCNGCNMKRLP